MSSSPVAQRIQSVKGRPVDHAAIAKEAVALAADLLHEAQKHISHKDRVQAEKMARMMTDANGKALTLALADQVFRAHKPSRIASQFTHLIHSYGVPGYLPFTERVLMRLGAFGAPILPGVVMPAVTEELREQSSQVILPSESARLKPHQERRRAAGTRLNLNQLGEAILGEEEAQHRLETNLKLLASPETEYISVKISAVFSQLNTLAFDDTVVEIQKRLRALYRAAQQHSFKRADGTTATKFVNLDMEEYRDLHLTAEAFKRTLMEPEFLKLKAGIVLQAYLPDSSAVHHDLTEWAKARVAAGGATIKIRIVKGANLAMERVEASSHGWEQAPYYTKADVDANFKRMVHYGCIPENARAVQIGVASHNLFDLAYALLLRSACGVEEFVELEMLEGMANHQAAAVQDAAHGLLLYAPIVSKDDFHSAIAYLVRRLDENTSEENFLHDLFGLEVDTPNWKKQADWFLESVKRANEVKIGPNRTQNRETEKRTSPGDRPFDNEPDTDWTLKPNRDWVNAIIEKARTADPEKIPLQIGGEFITNDYAGIGRDPARPGVEAYRYTFADDALIERAIDTAQNALPAWSARPVSERRDLLLKAAAALAQRRGELIAAAMLDGGKAVHESDPEISEAIDFANYYARAFDDASVYEGVTPTPLGIITITPPWNFPIAIPCGGALAALMAGNTVLFKPASDTVLCGWRLLNILWDAGIPREVLQFVTPARGAGKKLVADSRIAGVILTGASETADKFLDFRPSLRLFAETGGKNSLIITANADHDQAVKDLVKSAFGHCGQKCSAASLAILEAEVYDNPAFMKQLRDATVSLRVGPAWNTANVMTTLIHEPDETLKRGLTTLDAGEEWLLEPRMLDNNPCLWTPGIKRGVKPGSWYQQTECFGPVLGLVRADNLGHAIEIANSVKYGLTTGLHTLDDREISVWRDKIQAGNLYINRVITGAIVRRQPFGGWKASVYGPGAKAGGPNYVAQFCTWQQTTLPKNTAPLPTERVSEMEALSKWVGDGDAAMVSAAAGHFEYVRKTEFSVEHDPSKIHGEYNHFRYRPQPGVIIRATDGTSKADIALALLAARTAGIPAVLSMPQDLGVPAIRNVQVSVEAEDALAGRLERGITETVFRPLGDVSEKLLRAANKAHLAYVPGKPVANGRLEIRACYREQAVSHCYHRYGNIIPPPQ
ncbi:MAG: bifunctional proline dehydrogenase/L-glutamate gamma-semialdehyde dehydrogenase [Puniceicoccales bacterium]|jgi:RHH-type proline utilization regulon transcriptional repressor/proline dehydrogenase/delta 1-pyrroline-5-carboxylate dehydrogenase|nr:bifunctional proline dehydrogenase/L-glutamate gamma-semialdehyde dehydrogenase [Puniceicoccales bacterium]